jgi:predicted RNase H-like HicB family nuclease
MNNYIAVIHKDHDSDYGVSFPDFPGIATAGSTIDEAKNMAKEALELHIGGMLEDGEIIPEPLTLEDIVKRDDYVGLVAVLVVSAPMSKKKEPVRVNISIDPDVLALADQLAGLQGMTRSGFISIAVQREAGSFLVAKGRTTAIASRFTNNPIVEVSGFKPNKSNKRIKPAVN